MKKFFILISIVILAACSMSPGPTAEQLEDMRVQQDTEYVDARVVSTDDIMVIEFLVEEEPDTTKNKSRKVEMEEIEKRHKETQKNVSAHIEKIEQQQIILDSLLKEKRK
jgi:DNA-binding MarR family transcriptional regulator